MVQSPYLSLALGRLQLKRWIGMASSTVLRHPEGTASNKGWGRRKRRNVHQGSVPEFPLAQNHPASSSISPKSSLEK